MESTGRSTAYGLGFLALLAFVASFMTARIFATLNPTVIIEAQGIHLHHFWYGLAMVAAVGWLGIAHNDPRYVRLYAVVFGVGSGLIGDEVGLLLTLGNYLSPLTFVFFVLAVSLGSVAILLARFKKELEHDVLRLERGEAVAHAGLVVMGLSPLGFANGLVPLGAATLLAGLVIALAGYFLHLRRRL
jgi:hypothetical protein